MLHKNYSFNGANKKKNISFLRLAAGCILLAALFFSGYMIVDYMITGAQNVQSVNSVRTVYYDAFTDVDTQQTSPEAGIVSEAASEVYDNSSTQAYMALLAVNSEAVGWLSIPGTDIDYPVAQAADNDYYLNHSFLQKSSSHGCIFMDSQNDTGDLHIILYGHNMKDGTFFGQLSRFQDEAYCMGNSLIELNLWGQITQWKVFSVHRAGSKALPVKFDGSTQFISFLESLKAAAEFDTSCQIDGGDSILTLSTCETGGRLLIHAVRIED